MAKASNGVVPGNPPSVKIKYSEDGYVLGVEINGVEIPGITSLNLANVASQFSRLTLDIICGEVNIEHVPPTPPTPPQVKTEKKKKKKKPKKPAQPKNDDEERWDHI
jgi:hypothetical protein